MQIKETKGIIDVNKYLIAFTMLNGVHSGETENKPWREGHFVDTDGKTCDIDIIFPDGVTTSNLIQCIFESVVYTDLAILKMINCKLEE